MMLWELMWGHRRPRRRGACPYTPGPTSYLWQSVAKSNARWLLRPRSEVELFLKTVSRFVASQTQPLQKQIAELKARIEELQARKFCGVHQRALGYKSGAQATFDNGLWIARHKINVHPLTSDYAGSTMMSALKNPAPRSMAVAYLTPRVSLGGFVQA